MSLKNLSSLSVWIRTAFKSLVQRRPMDYPMVYPLENLVQAFSFLQIESIHSIAGMWKWLNLK